MRKLFQGTNLLYTLGILALLVVAAFIKVPIPTIQLPAEKIFHIGGFPITNTFLATIVADITVLIIAFFATHKMSDVPSGMQNLAEWFFEAFEGMLTDIAGKENTRKWIPIFMTIMIFLTFANWWELIPGIDAVGVFEPLEVAYVESGRTVTRGYEKGSFLLLPSLDGKKGVTLTEEERQAALEESEKAEAAGLAYHPEHPKGYVLKPFLRVAASDLNLPLALALISVFWTQVVGFQFLKGKYLRRFVVPVITGNKLIDGFVGALEFISEIAKIISFSFRLFGNVFAGQVLLFIMTFLLAFLLPLPFFALELFVGFMQAFVFAILTFIFMSQAIQSHAGDEHH